MSEYSSSVYSKPSSDNGIPEFYNVVRGKTEEFGIEGYKISKKPDLLVINEFIIGKAKLRNMYTEIAKRSKDPSPVSYSPTHQKVVQEYWTPRNGKFGKARRKSYVDEILKVHGPIPGPGEYLKEPKGKPLKKGQFGFIA